jgi:hypothetical protein
LKIDFAQFLIFPESKQVTFPWEVSVTIFAEFLDYIPCTTIIQINQPTEQVLVFEGEDIPLISAAIPDHNFLRERNLKLLITVNSKQTENLLGQSYIHLRELIENEGKATNF